MRIKGHVGVASVPGGSNISPIYIGWYYNGDTAPWAHPAIGFKLGWDMTLTPSNTNAYLTSVIGTSADFDVLATDYANFFSTSKIFGTGASSPFAYMYMPNVTSPVGTWNVDAYSARLLYSYDTPPGGSRGARCFFDYRD